MHADDDSASPLTADGTTTGTTGGRTTHRLMPDEKVKARFKDRPAVAAWVLAVRRELVAAYGDVGPIAKLVREVKTRNPQCTTSVKALRRRYSEQLTKAPGPSSKLADYLLRYGVSEDRRDEVTKEFAALYEDAHGEPAPFVPRAAKPPRQPEEPRPEPSSTDTATGELRETTGELRELVPALRKMISDAESREDALRMELAARSAENDRLRANIEAVSLIARPPGTRPAPAVPGVPGAPRGPGMPPPYASVAPRQASPAPPGTGGSPRRGRSAPPRPGMSGVPRGPGVPPQAGPAVPSPYGGDPRQGYGGPPVYGRPYYDRPPFDDPFALPGRTSVAHRYAMLARFNAQQLPLWVEAESRDPLEDYWSAGPWADIRRRRQLDATQVACLFEDIAEELVRQHVGVAVPISVVPASTPARLGGRFRLGRYRGRHHERKPVPQKVPREWTSRGPTWFYALLGGFAVAGAAMFAFAMAPPEPAPRNEDTPWLIEYANDPHLYNVPYLSTVARTDKSERVDRMERTNR